MPVTTIVIGIVLAAVIVEGRLRPREASSTSWLAAGAALVLTSTAAFVVGRRSC